MSISPAAIISIFIVIYVFVKEKNMTSVLIALFTINVCWEIFISIGYFAIVDNTNFEVKDFLQFIMVFVSLFVYLRGKDVVVPFCLMLLFGIIILNQLMIVINPYEKLVRIFSSSTQLSSAWYHYPETDIQTIKTSVRLASFFWNACAVAQVIKKEHWLDVRSILVKCGIFIIIFGWLEFLCKNVFHYTAYTNFLDMLFGERGSVLSIMNGLRRNGLYVVIGLDNEPSQFAKTLFIVISLYIITDNDFKKRKRYNLLFASATILMFLTGSFRTVMFIPVLIILYLIKRGTRFKTKLIVMSLVFLTLIAYHAGLLNYFIDRIDNAFLFMQTGIVRGASEAGRLNTLAEAIKVFLDRPLMGIGLGTTSCYAFLPDILQTFGLTGTGMWFYIMFFNIGRVGRNKQGIWILTVLVLTWTVQFSLSTAYSIAVLCYAIEMRSGSKKPDSQNRDIPFGAKTLRW